jgi:septum formation protein
VLDTGPSPTDAAKGGDGTQTTGSTPALILAADTIVYLPTLGVLGKPTNEADALRMLMALRSTTHQVYSGICVINAATGTCTLASDCTSVTFGPYTPADARAYIATGEPMDKAGAYAIQGQWATHVTAIHGDRENVIGLPWHLVAPLLPCC